ncbi:MAG: hypothetical protein IBX64_13550 [Actinobacteria bacterium]|nr:hypothetical protein [Actinomycetota bacterium]
MAQEHKRDGTDETILYKSANLKDYEVLGSVPTGEGYFHVSPENKKVLFCISAQAYGQKGIWKSQDGGRSWRNIFKEPVDFLLFYPTKATTMLVIKNNDPVGAEIFISKNQGENWSKFSVIQKALSVSQIAVNPKDPKKMIAVAHNGVWSTVDNGQTWSNIFTESRPAGVAYNPKSPDEAYLATQDGVYRVVNNEVSKMNISEDCPNGWTRKLIFRPKTRTLYFLNEKENTSLCRIENGNAKTITTFESSKWSVFDLLFDSGSSKVLYGVSYDQLIKIELDN